VGNEEKATGRKLRLRPAFTAHAIDHLPRSTGRALRMALAKLGVTASIRLYSFTKNEVSLVI
jgi:hypothetical protein